MEETSSGVGGSGLGGEVHRHQEDRARGPLRGGREWGRLRIGRRLGSLGLRAKIKSRGKKKTRRNEARGSIYHHKSLKGKGCQP